MKLKSILKKIYFFPWSFFCRIKLGFQRVKCNSNLEVIGNIWIKNRGTVTIGKNVRIRSGAWTNPIGCGNKTFIHVFKNATLKIGNHVKMSNVGISCQENIKIEDEVMIGGGTCIWDTDFHSTNLFIRMQLIEEKEYPKTAPILIKKGAFIGAGCYILKGVTIGENSIVGAASVVSKDIPDNQVWAGNPAGFIRNLRPEEINGKNK